MSWQLKLYLSEQVINLQKMWQKSGDKNYLDLANELQEVLNGVLEIKGSVK